MSHFLHLLKPELAKFNDDSTRVIDIYQFAVTVLQSGLTKVLCMNDANDVFVSMKKADRWSTSVYIRSL